MATEAASLFVRMIADTQQFTTKMKQVAQQSTTVGNNLDSTATDARQLGGAVNDAGQRANRGFQNASSGASEFKTKLGRTESAAREADAKIEGLTSAVRGVDGRLRDTNTGKFVKEMDQAGDAAARADRRMDKAGRSGNGLGSGLAATGKGIGLAVGAAAVAGGLFAKSAIGAALESQKLGKQTEAIVKATGGAAGLSAKQIDKLAISMSMKTGVDDEAIKKSANILLTFKQVRNETGKGNDIFTQATHSMMDLSNVFGSSDSAAKMLGKALSDPVKGVSALSRAGVNFSQEQKDMIKAMVASGDTMGAQKLILKEIESQVGGTAEATATAGDRMKVVFGNLLEQVGGVLLENFNKFATVMVDKVLPALSKAYNEYLPKVKDAFNKVWTAIKPLANILKDKLATAFKAVGKFAKENKEVVVAFVAALAAASVIAGVVALGAAIVGLFNPVTLIIIGFAALVAALVYAYKHFKWFRKGVEGVINFFKAAWPDIQKVVKRVFGIVIGMFTMFIEGAKAYWSLFGDGIIRVWKGIWNIVKGIFNIFLGVFSGNWSRAWQGVIDVFSGIFGVLGGLMDGTLKMITAIFTGALDLMVSILKGIGNAIAAVWNALWSGIKAVASAIWDGIVGAIKWYLEAVSSSIRAVLDFIIGFWSGAWTLLVGFVSGAFNGIVSFVQGLGKRISDAASGLWDGLTSGLKGAVNLMLTLIERMLNGIIRGVNAITSKINEIPGPFPDIPAIDFVTLPRLAKGGIVNSPTLALIGEAGPEAVVPLTGANLPQGIRGPQYANSGSKVSGGSQTTYNVTVNVPPMADPAKVGQAVVDSLVAWSRRNGAIPVAANG